jgi:acyl carrier protein
MAEIADRIRTLIADELGVDHNKVVDGADFTSDLGADSLDTVELIMALEEEFDIEVTDEDAERLTTVGAVISYMAGLA